MLDTQDLVNVSIPSRPRGRLQVRDLRDDMREDNRVSIPSRPRGRLQGDGPPLREPGVMFQSPAGPVAGCRAVYATRSWSLEVSIPSRPRGRLQVPQQRAAVEVRQVSIPSRPRGRLQALRGSRSLYPSVSIPSRPRGRLQAGLAVGYMVWAVSIPSRPRGRLQAAAHAGTCDTIEFQSPAGPVAGCRGMTDVDPLQSIPFQSPAGPVAGCRIGVER